MAFTLVTVTHDYDVPAVTGALGAVEFTPVEPLHNGAKTVVGPRRAVLAGDGTISIQLEATTDPGTWPTGVRYRVTERITGIPSRIYYISVPHNQGSTLDLDTLIAGSGASTAGGGLTYSPVTLSAAAGMIVPDATKGYGPHRYTATTDITLATPTGGSNGEPLEVQVYASGADRALTVAGSTSLIPAGTWWWGHFSYVGGLPDTWLLDDSSGGGAGGVSAANAVSADQPGVRLVIDPAAGYTPAAGEVVLRSIADGLPAGTVTDNVGDTPTFVGPGPYDYQLLPQNGGGGGGGGGVTLLATRTESVPSGTPVGFVLRPGA